MAAKKRVRHTIDMVFTSEEEKVDFKRRVDVLKTLFSPPGATKHEKIENAQLLLELFKLAEGQGRELPAAPQTVPQTGSFLQKGGMSVSVISYFDHNAVTRHVLWQLRGWFVCVREGLSV